MDDRRISIEELRQQQQRNWPEMFRACSPALLRFIRLNDMLMRESGQSLLPSRLMPAEFDVLAALRRQPPPHSVSPTELCHALLISSGGLTKLLYRLQDKGLIRRPPNPADGRSLLVELSDLGKRQVEAAMADLMQVHAAQISSLSDSEQLTLNTLLEKLLLAAHTRSQRGVGEGQFEMTAKNQ